MNFIKKSLRWINLLLVLVTLLAYLSPFIDPARVWPFTFLGLAYPVLLLGNIFFVIFWAWQKNRYFLFSLACIVAGLGYFTSFFGFHVFKNGEKKEGEITVMTYNIAGMRRFDRDKKEQKESKLALLEKLAQEAGQPDILCVQEGRGDEVMKTIRKVFGYTHHFQHKGTVIFSKFPFVKQDVVAFESVGNSCIWADLKTPDGIVRVYCAHLQSNSLSYTANKIATKGDIREKQTWRDIRFVLKQYKKAVAIRAGQAQAVKNHMDQSPYPVLLCGDLNDPPVSYVYRLLSDGLQDSFKEKGFGISSTFAGKLPALRIDYVLASPVFKIKDHRLSGVELSDHFPVWVRLAQ